MAKKIEMQAIAFSSDRSILNGVFPMQLPTASKILKVESLFNSPRFYYEYDTANASNPETRTFKIYTVGDSLVGNPTQTFVSMFFVDSQPFFVYEL